MAKWIFIGVVFLTTSCSLIIKQDKPTVETEVFVDVLVDIHMADAIITEKGFRVSSDSVRISRYYDDVFKKHGISRKQFDETINYYSRHANNYKFVYDDVIDKLMKMHEEFGEQMKQKK